MKKSLDARDDVGGFALRQLHVGLALVALGVLAALFVFWRPAQDAGPAVPAGQLTSAADEHAGHGPGAGSEIMVGADIRVDDATARALGLTVATVEIVPIRRSIRTTGNVVFDETRLTTVTPKFGGFAERLHVDFTGQAVQRGQPLLEIYSPELVAAQEELLSALRMQRDLRPDASLVVIERSRTLVDAARRRLLLWDVSPARIEQIVATGTVPRTVSLHSPSSGFVTELLVQTGQTVEAGAPLYRLADLSRVWVEADVYEQDLRFVALGETAHVDITAYPGEHFEGRIGYVYPEVRSDTRTARVRIELANPDGRIKPGMYATVSIDVPVEAGAMVVPRDAVMYSGTHAMVFVEVADGQYQAREVLIGTDSPEGTEILSGLMPGERVVTRANFLLDSESRLREGMGAMPGMNH